MLRKIVGDVRVGWVDTTWGTFNIPGDPDRTLDTLKDGLRIGRAAQTLEPTVSLEARYVPFTTIHGVGMVAAKYTS